MYEFDLPYESRYYKLMWSPVESPFPFHPIDLHETREEAERSAREQGFEWIEVTVQELDTENEGHNETLSERRYVRVRPLLAEKPQFVTQPTAEAAPAQRVN